MVVNARSLKRMKRRVTADLHDFLTFPSYDAAFLAGGTCRSNVKEFLSRHALLPPPYSFFPHLMTWQILLRVGDLTDGMAVDGSPVVVGLDVVEEDVARSRSVYCDQCRVVGWSGHPVCTKRYHFIVKGDGASIGGHVKPCTRCGIHVHLSEPRCKACNYVMTSEDVEDWMYQQLEDTSHLLHGVIHENGYGHLLRINGIEGGSKVLSGFHIMDFWDRLCKYLGVRFGPLVKVSSAFSVLQIHRKASIALRRLSSRTALSFSPFSSDIIKCLWCTFGLVFMKFRIRSPQNFASLPFLQLLLFSSYFDLHARIIMSSLHACES